MPEVASAIWSESAIHFYDTAYQLVKRDLSIPVDQSGKCVVAEENLSGSVYSVDWIAGLDYWTGLLDWLLDL